MAVQKDPQRLVFFTDAVVAIAVTLLVLPLVDVAPEVAREHHSAVEVITKHQPEVWTYLLSFVVIIRLWLAHHRTYEHVGAYSTPLMLCNSAWLLAIVTLPFPTEMIGVFHSSRFTAALYIGTVLVANALQTAMNLIIKFDPEVASEENPVGPDFGIGSVTATVLLVAALVFTLAVPTVNYWPLLLLLLSSPVEWFWRRRRLSKAAA
ncbi:TMEM175 family protein [Actinomadura sp. DC4]|uniref:TMEM175 family protein n=1 Tax=Actinomadura sp. DC4 TaxID=3055069 RepID=UPI0025B0758B|nr:TMEM175 family protein [Actinomadura sp. DC4]MDN3355557.1 TMEM175 family protein [Actinomadura sp. DC4]